MRARSEVADLARSWLGKNEKDGSHKEIIDIYNSHSPLPRNYKMLYTASWCACFWSALAIKLGYTDIMPVEISCGNLITIAKKMGIWEERDDYIPSQGDAILYDWQDKGSGDNEAWPDHIGMVEYSDKEESGYIVAIEGNYDDCVKKRTISINGKYIRGFITPKYDMDTISVDVAPGKDIKTLAMEVIAGVWGSGETRKKSLASVGYDYKEVQAMVNQILNGKAEKPVEVIPAPSDPKVETSVKRTVKTTCVAKGFSKSIAAVYKTSTDVYCRNDAGTNKKALCIIPKGSSVRCYGYYNTYKGVKWYLIAFDSKEGVHYEGFIHSTYLKRG